jgi:hypothetical protein
MSAEKRFTSFAEFFPYYLAEHSSPANRALHYAGSLSVVFALVYGLATLNVWVLLGLPLIGYGPAWVGHFLIEKNRPATFLYPKWSLWGDFKMLGLFLSGRLSRHLPKDP